MEIKITFSQNIKYLIQTKRLTVRALAKLMDKDETTIYKWAQGTREPTFRETIKLARFLNVTVDELGTGDISKTLEK